MGRRIRDWLGLDPYRAEFLADMWFGFCVVMLAFVGATAVIFVLALLARLVDG